MSFDHFALLRSDRKFVNSFMTVHAIADSTFTTGKKKEGLLEPGTYQLLFDELVVGIDPNQFRWGLFRMVNFVAASRLDIRGLRNDYRWPGIRIFLMAPYRPGRQRPGQ